MTPAEKNKLYTAIGYSETAVNPNLPKNVSSMAKKICIQKLSTVMQNYNCKGFIARLAFMHKELVMLRI